MLSGEASRAKQQASERPPRASPNRKLYHSHINASRPASRRGRQVLIKRTRQRLLRSERPGSKRCMELQAAKAIEHHAERQAAKAFELQASGEPSWPMSAVPSELPKPSCTAPGRPRTVITGNQPRSIRDCRQPSEPTAQQQLQLRTRAKTQEETSTCRRLKEMHAYIYACKQW